MKLKSKIGKVFLATFILVSFVLLIVFGVSNKIETVKTHSIRNLAVDVNPNINIENIDAANSLLKCDWWSNDKSKTLETRILESQFDKAECGEYLPNWHSRYFFLYLKNVSTIFTSGIIVYGQDSEGNEDYYIPRVVSSNYIIATTGYNSFLQEFREGSDSKTKEILGDKISLPAGELGLLLTVDKPIKLKSISLGAIYDSGQTKTIPLTISAHKSTESIVGYAGYLEPGATIRTMMNKISSNNVNNVSKRYKEVFRIDNPNDINTSRVDLNFKFYNANEFESWNRIAFNKNFFNVDLCENYLINDRKLIGIPNTTEFCNFLNSAYSTDSFYQSNDMYMVPNTQDLSLVFGSFKFEIDGNNELASYPWDFIYFQHYTELTFKNFNINAIQEIFWTKLVALIVNRVTGTKVEKITLNNVLLNSSFIQKHLVPLIENANLSSFDISNNVLSFEDISPFFNNVNVEELILNNNIFSIDNLDLSNLVNLKKLVISDSSVNTLTLNSEKLEEVTINRAGLSNIVGLDGQKNNLNVLNFAENNIASISLPNFFNLSVLDLSKNALTNITLLTGQSASNINLSFNALQEFSYSISSDINSIDISNNGISRITLDANSLKNLNASKNFISFINMSKNILDSLETIDISGNKKISEMLDTYNFSAKNLEEFRMEDAEATKINQAWFGNNLQNLSIYLGNVDEISTNDNNIDALEINTLQNLKSLNLENLGVKSITISNTPKLENLFLDKTAIQEISLETKSLEVVSLKLFAGNIDSLITPLENQRKLSQLIIESSLTNQFLRFMERAFFPSLEHLELNNTSLVEIPTFIQKYKRQLRKLSLKNAKFDSRFDLLGYNSLEELDLSGNQDLFSIINLDKVTQLKTLILNNINRAIDKIGSSSDSITRLEIRDTNTKSVSEIKTSFPNVVFLDISGNNVSDLYTLTGSSTEEIQATQGSNVDVASILEVLPTVHNIYYRESEFDLLSLLKGQLANVRDVYKIYVDANKIVLKDGDLSLLKTWYDSLAFRKIFLLDSNEENVYLNEALIERVFSDYEKKYLGTIDSNELSENKEQFSNEDSLRNYDSAVQLQNDINAQLNLKYSDKIIPAITRKEELDSILNSNISGALQRLENWEIILLVLLGTSALIIFGVTVSYIVLARIRQRK